MFKHIQDDRHSWQRAPTLAAQTADLPLLNEEQDEGARVEGHPKQQDHGDEQASERLLHHRHLRQHVVGAVYRMVHRLYRVVIAAHQVAQQHVVDDVERDCGGVVGLVVVQSPRHDERVAASRATGVSQVGQVGQVASVVVCRVNCKQRTRFLNR